jgi:hypothetical protein
MKASACVISVFVALASENSLQAQFSVGTWVQTAPMKGFTMTVEECCSVGRRLVFHVALGQKAQTITIESRFDGSDAPVVVDGKPNGETMALKASMTAGRPPYSREMAKSSARRRRPSRWPDGPSLSRTSSLLRLTGGRPER